MDDLEIVFGATKSSWLPGMPSADGSDSCTAVLGTSAMQAFTDSRLNLWGKPRTTIHRVHHSSPAPPTKLRPPCTARFQTQTTNSRRPCSPARVSRLFTSTFRRATAAALPAGRCSSSGTGLLPSSRPAPAPRRGGRSGWAGMPSPNRPPEE